MLMNAIAQVLLAGRGVDGALVQGGRWDGLCAAAGLGERCCGGLSLHVNKMIGAILSASSAGAAAAARGAGGGGGGPRPPPLPSAAAEVLVCCAGSAAVAAQLHKEKLRLVSELWQVIASGWPPDGPRMAP